MYFEIDDRFKEYFKASLNQVFLYVTDDCNLRCAQCLYKPFLKKDREIKLEVALALISKFREMGASKLSLIGGEPTRYGLLDGNRPLLAVISEAKRLGYEYVRLDTNGQFEDTLLSKEDFKRLDELSFSIDGHTPEVDEAVRGKGSFNKCVSNIKEAVEIGYNVNVTCCVHRGNVGRDQNGNPLLDSMIQLVTSLGVSRINFHPVFKMGIPRDGWQEETDIPPVEWMNLYSEIRINVDNKIYDISVRIPQRFVSREEFERDPSYYGFCPVKMGGRVLVHPNGQIRVCALTIGTPYAIAKFEESNGGLRIKWETEMNELEHNNFDLDKPTPCTNQRRNFGNLVPLCISFKPKQDEFAWKKIRRV